MFNHRISEQSQRNVNYSALSYNVYYLGGLKSSGPNNEKTNL